MGKPVAHPIDDTDAHAIIRRGLTELEAEVYLRSYAAKRAQGLEPKEALAQVLGEKRERVQWIAHPGWGTAGFTRLRWVAG